MSPDFYAHRDRLLASLAPDEALLVFAGPHHLRNADAEYRYRPDSDLYYLCGWEQPGAAVFLRPSAEPFVLFCQPRDPTREQWEGHRPGPEGAVADYGADRAYVMSELKAELPRLLQGVRVLHYDFARDANHDATLMSCVRQAARAARKNGLDAPETFHSLSYRLHEQRLHKSADELNTLREAARITAAGHRAAMTAAKPGLPEYALEAALIGTFLREGSTGPGYTSIVAGGAEACVLHYVTNRAPLPADGLVLIDAGAEHAYYTADVTRTFPVSGRFSPAQREVYEVVLAAQEAAIACCRAGNRFDDVHQAAVRVLTEGMVRLGLLQGEVDSLIEADAHKAFYVHNTSHWLGLDVHDVGAYGRQGQSRLLAPGMVLTVEPGLYLQADDARVPEAYRGIGIRIEDDILVTDGDPDNLTAMIPKTVAEIERACAS